jgi:hypothetical protein
MPLARRWLVLAAAIVAYELVSYRRGTGSPMLTVVGLIARRLR